MPTQKYKYKINQPTQKTLKRMKEVQFYIFLESFFYKYNKDNQYILNMIESIAELYDCRPSMISILIDNFKSPIYKPDKEEIVVTSYHLGIPVRKLSKITKIGIETYYRHLNKYIANGQHDLEPRVADDYVEEMTKFLANASVMFGDVSNSLKGMKIYD